MYFIKEKNILGLVVFLDFEKVFDWNEWNFIYKCFEMINFDFDFW